MREIPGDDKFIYRQKELALTDEQWLRYKTLYAHNWSPELDAFVCDRWRTQGETIEVMVFALADWVRLGHDL
jgi:hypothetical protein